MNNSHAYASPTPLAGSTPTSVALNLLSYEQLRKLRNTSRSIRALGLLWGISGLASAYFGAMMLTSHENALLGFFALSYGVALAVAGPYAAWARPGWARVVCIVLSVFTLATPRYGILLGILSLVALSRAKPLFGDNKLSHQALEAEYSGRA